MRASATPWTCGSTAAGDTTAACAGESRRPRKSCRGGELASRPKSSSAATRDIFWFGFYTGMRLGEIFGLRWDQVDLERPDASGSKRPRAAFPWSSPSPASLPRSWPAGVQRPATEPARQVPGSFHPRPARQDMSRNCNTCMRALDAPPERSSGSTVFATPSSRWPSVNSCCPARSRSGS